MLEMQNQIALYEEMTVLSSRMVEAARNGEWDDLIALERSVNALRMRMIEEDDNSRLDIPERERKASLIRRILADDAEIRRHTEPWMEHLRQYLGDAHKKRQVDRAYGARSF
ncbi:MAG TPA: flagellar protein FliT [Rhodocyclaceae bacterium]|jgi:flagellar protein FliT|nr:flagellar protein FliT [Rhodocyclaceae bacterium]